MPYFLDLAIQRTPKTPRTPIYVSVTVGNLGPHHLHLLKGKTIILNA